MAEQGRDRGPHDPAAAVRGVGSHEHEVILERLQRRSEDLRRRQGARAHEGRIAHEHRARRAHRERLADGIGDAGGRHRQEGHVAPVRVDELKGRLEDVLVVAVDHRAHAAVQPPVGAEAFLTGVGHRLDEHHDPHDLDLSLREPNGV